jgi:acid phosphatase (class A)
MMLRYFAVAMVIVAACARPGVALDAAPVPELRPGLLVGYLPSGDAASKPPRLAPPPAPGSAELGLDEDLSKKALALRDTPRWKLASSDSNLRFPYAAGSFSCALEALITEQDTPRLYTLLRRTLTDAVLPAGEAKGQYDRERPFERNKEPICTPGDESSLAGSSSYPSGHAAVAWVWALLLAEVAPVQRDAILARGRSLGVSRSVCNVHWHSDVIQGQSIAEGIVAKLHEVPAFREDIEAARAELAAARSKDLKPTRNCAEEASAQAMDPSPAR